MSAQGASPARLKFRSINGILIAGALASLSLGYWLLANGSTRVAPVLLVLGYCVMFPLGLGL